MDSQGYELHPEACGDVDEIRGYIAADKRADLTDRPLRFIRVRDYVIAYAPDEKPLWVIAVMHGHRSPRVMAAILRGREEQPSSF
ncbi:MAG: hypothetical protein IT165_21175 [Bryobacterales bacterium]|nr:hypothetical protein [Bryobacterales bacterium]